MRGQQQEFAYRSTQINVCAMQELTMRRGSVNRVRSVGHASDHARRILHAFAEYQVVSLNHDQVTSRRLLVTNF